MGVAEGAQEIDTQTGGSASTARPSKHDGVVLGVGAIVVGTIGVMTAAGEVFPDALAFLLVIVGVAVWASRSNSVRSRWVLAGLVTLFVAVNLVFAIPDLSHPESPAPFVATVIVVGAGLITVTLAVLSARRRPAAAGRIWLSALVGLGVLVVVALVAAAGVEDDEVQPGDTEIAAQDIEFPDSVDVDPDSTGLVVENKDLIRHTIVIEDQVSAVELPAGSTIRVELDLEPGQYRYYCDVTGHDDMEGTLVVQ